MPRPSSCTGVCSPSRPSPWVLRALRSARPSPPGRHLRRPGAEHAGAEALSPALAIREKAVGPDHPQVAQKSIDPLAARVAPGDTQQLHHFVSTSPWPTAPLEEELVRGCGPAGRWGGRGAGRGRYRPSQARSALGGREAPVLRPAREEGELPGAGLAHSRQGRSAGLHRPAPVPARGLVCRCCAPCGRRRARDDRLPPEVADSTGRDRSRAGRRRPFPLCAGGCRVRQGGRVPSRARRTAAQLRGRHPADAEGLSGERDARHPRAQANRPLAQAPDALGPERASGRADRGSDRKRSAPISWRTGTKALLKAAFATCAVRVADAPVRHRRAAPPRRGGVADRRAPRHR